MERRKDEFTGGDRKKLNDKVLSVSFDTEGKQGITGILGASGCGKSMTLKCIAGIETPDRGKIVLNGRVLFDSGKKSICACRTDMSAIYSRIMHCFRT